MSACTTESHEQAKQQPEVWSALELRGYMEDELPDGRPARLELRQCGACQSTLAVQVPGEVP